MSDLAEDHKRIWLQPVCHVEERCWCEDPIVCDDCGLEAVEYIRADIVTDMLALLKWLDSKGGLGLDVHERIRAVIGKAEGESAHSAPYNKEIGK